MICTKQNNGTYFAICPELTSCFTQGDSYEEATSNLKELVEITVREELSDDDMQELLTSTAKIFSELEIIV